MSHLPRSTLRARARNRKLVTAQLEHAKKRALERYGLVINRQDIARAVRQILSGKSVCAFAQSLGRKWHWVDVQGRECLVVYGRTRRNIITFLPPDAIPFNVEEKDGSPNKEDRSERRAA